MTGWHIGVGVLVIIVTMVLFFRRSARRKLEAQLQQTIAALSSLLDHAPVAIIATTHDGRISHFNPGAERLLGCPRAEAMGQPLLSFHDPKELAALSPDGLARFEALLSVTRPNGTSDAEWTWLDRQGHRLRVRIVLQAIGANAGYVLVALDLTEHRREETERRELGLRVQKLAAQIPGAVFQYRRHADHREEFIYLSSGVQGLLGLSVAELTSEPGRFRELVQEGDVHLLTQVITQGRCIFRITRDGHTRWLMVVASSEQPADGGLLVNGFATDITEQRAVEAQLELAREQALVASRAKADFLGNMSHEIRTPLNGILGLTQLVLETKLEASQRESLDAVLKSGHTLLTLVNDVLDLSRIESGTLPLEVVSFPLESLLTEVAAVVGPAAAEKGLELTIELEPAVAPVVSGDPTRLRQLLTNLLGNAVKFTSEGHIGLTLVPLSRGVRFAVTDTGIGIPIEQQISLGQPFTQLDSSTTRRHGGSGLGLALTRRMVDRMGGRFAFSSQPNVGTTFTVDLPLPASGEAPAPPQRLEAHVVIISPSAPLRDATRRTLEAAGAAVTTLEAADHSTAFEPGVDVALVDTRSVSLLAALRDNHPGVRMVQLSATTQVSEPTPGIMRLTRPVLPSTLLKAIRDRWTPTPSQPPPSEGSAEGLSVLLAEDNPINAKVVTTLLRRDGHFVVLATDGKAAIAAFEVGSFDLILMDVQMPETDGLEATRAIRRFELTQGTHVPIIALTASAMTGDIGRCLEAGMDDFLSKPLNLTQLRARIRALRPPTTPAPRSEAPAPSPS